MKTHHPFFKKLRICLVLLVFLETGLLSTSTAYADTALLFRGNPNLPMMALTFDDGGSVANVRSVLNTLDQYGVHATFFFVGKFIDANPVLMQELVAKGHEMGNHSYNHPDLTKTSYSNILGELSRSATAFRNATGVEMKPYVRPPYGAKNATVLQAIFDAGYTHTVLWNVDTNDWQGKTPSQLVRHVLSHAGNGNIVLMHTTSSSNSYKALPQMIEGLQNKGYQLVTVSELIKNTGRSSIATLGPEDISQVEFLNNLLFAKTGSYSANIKEIREKAIPLGILTANEFPSFHKALSSEECLTYIQRAYPDKTNLAGYFVNMEWKKSNLPMLIEIMEGF